MDLSEYDILIYQYYLRPNHKHTLHVITSPTLFLNFLFYIFIFNKMSLFLSYFISFSLF